MLRFSDRSKRPTVFFPSTRTELVTIFSAERTPISGTMSLRLSLIRLTTSLSVMLLVTSPELLLKLEVTLKKDSLSSRLSARSTMLMISVTIKVVYPKREEVLLEEPPSALLENSTSLQSITSLKNIIKTPSS